MVSYKGNETDVYIPLEIGKTPVSYIGDGCFRDCKSIISVIIPEGIIEIGKCAFKGCSSLENINIPESVEKIGDDIFYHCPSITYTQYENGLYLGNENNPYLILVKAMNQQIEKCIINEKTKYIYPYAFSGCMSLSVVDIPESVVEIGECAFIGCRALSSVKVMGELKKIGYCVFFKCEKISILGKKGSTAEDIAKTHNFPFVEV
ncbi:MAG: leucine-rich repeat domain-containing protein [Clostridia bacterium]|nr:leucine-rich repeat domain-containing protein [Clostridia bacterium]